MKQLNNTKSPVFVLLCVLCFQRKSFRVLFHDDLLIMVEKRKAVLVQLIFLWHGNGDCAKNNGKTRRVGTTSYSGLILASPMHKSSCRHVRMEAKCCKFLPLKVFLTLFLKECLFSHIKIYEIKFNIAIKRSRSTQGYHFSNFNWLMSPILLTRNVREKSRECHNHKPKPQDHWPFGPREEIFKVFLPYMGMAATLIM